MSNLIVCDGCSTQYLIKDEHAGKKLKCNKCGAIIVIPPIAPTSSKYSNEFNNFAVVERRSTAPVVRDQESWGHTESISAAIEVRGKPAILWPWAVVPQIFGQTTLRLLPARIAEVTRRPIARRSCEISLSEVDSAEIVVQGNPNLLLLGIITLGLFGLGIIFFYLYFFYFKHRILIIRSRGGNTLAVVLRGDDAPYRAFMQSVLSAAEGTRARSSPSS